jgi:ketosteroid isomerase-like protein
MPQENVEVVRTVIDGFNRGDWDAALEPVAPDAVFDNSRAMGEQRGVYTSHEQMRRVWEWLADLWESVWIEIDETIVSGEEVVVPHTIRYRGRDGIEVQSRTIWVFTVRDRRVQRVCLFQTKQEALEAAGLAE